jgi:hypothetical protein
MNDSVNKQEDIDEEMSDDYYEHPQKYNDYLLENLEDLLA